jgi:predicted 3-demethylubiquinone-9 3-methyltransferase (glyoxalase superfamily)
MHKIQPFYWFDDKAEEAANLYVSLFGGARIVDTRRWGPGTPFPEGSVLSVEFEIDGRSYIAFNGGPTFQLTEAASLSVTVDTQEELDALWDGLLANGGEPSQCGWLKDPYGLSWQIVPAILEELMRDPDPGRSSRATQAMLQMSKLDIAALKAAADG